MQQQAIFSTSSYEATSIDYINRNCEEVKVMNIMRMSVKELVLIDAFTDLAREASFAEKVINKNFKNSFGVGQKELQVFCAECDEGYYGECFLSIDGFFRYHDTLHECEIYEFSSDAEGIYRMFRSCYLLKNNLEALETEKSKCPYEYLDDYFREFIHQLIRNNYNN